MLRRSPLKTMLVTILGTMLVTMLGSALPSSGFFGLIGVSQAAANTQQVAAAELVDTMMLDLEKLRATDTGDEIQRRERILNILDTYFDMDAVTRISVGQYWRVATDEEKTEYAELLREVLLRTILNNFDQLKGLVYTAGDINSLGKKFVVVSGVFSDTLGNRPNVRVNWRAVIREGKPVKLFDIEIENLSLLDTQKQENIAVIRRNKGKFSALIDLMRERTE